jgi:nicotinic acid mononucleotide adenylyltransferase
MHVQVFDVAAKFLREHFSVDCLAGFLSPSCQSYVRGKLGNQAIPFEHRLEMCSLSCQAHNEKPDVLPVFCDPWEGSQSYFADFSRVRDRLAKLIAKTFPEAGLLVLYLCGADHFERCGLEEWDNCVAIARPPYSVQTVSKPEKGIYVCTLSQEGYTELYQDVSSTEIRRRLQSSEPLTGLVYPTVEQYLREQVLPSWLGTEPT